MQRGTEETFSGFEVGPEVTELSGQPCSGQARCTLTPDVKFGSVLRFLTATQGA